MKGYFYAFNPSFNIFDTLLNTRDRFLTPSDTFRIASETSFSHLETFFNDRERLLIPRNAFRIDPQWSFTYFYISFTCLDRWYNVSGCIYDPIGGVNNFARLLMNVSEPLLNVLRHLLNVLR